MTGISCDPYDDEIDADPYPIWKRMRDEAPPYYNDTYDFYAVTRYADVRDLSVGSRPYSSAYGVSASCAPTSSTGSSAPAGSTSCRTSG